MRVAGGSKGSANHILLAMIGQALGVDAYALTYLPFSGGGPAGQAVLEGRARAGISNWSEFAPHIESGQMRALALSGEARYLGVEVPTLREGGIDAVLYNWNGVFAPPGIDKEARADLEALVDAMVRSGAWQSETTQRRWEVFYLPRQEFEPFLRTEMESVEQILARLSKAKPRQNLLETPSSPKPAASPVSQPEPRSLSINDFALWYDLRTARTAGRNFRVGA